MTSTSWLCFLDDVVLDPRVTDDPEVLPCRVDGGVGRSRLGMAVLK